MTNKKNDKKVKEALKEEELNKVTGGIGTVTLVPSRVSHQLFDPDYDESFENKAPNK